MIICKYGGSCKLSHQFGDIGCHGLASLVSFSIKLYNPNRIKPFHQQHPLGVGSSPVNRWDETKKNGQLIRCWHTLHTHMLYIWSRPPSLHPPPSPPPHGLGPQVAAPLPFYLQAIGSISEVQLRIC